MTCFPPDSGDWVNCDSTKQQKETEIHFNDFVLYRSVCRFIWRNNMRNTKIKGICRKLVAMVKGAGDKRDWNQGCLGRAGF